ncbi:AAA family ATPase (plasmid) [Streptomyces sp. NBC_00513]|uniref:AAA family ATPase n=1 Tax=unclassified Streptomyces TaxID=2593676 RepID=UPI0022536A3A|nr:AAA family ATPase [Streptomyces sp. NBC_00424]MCX5078818.1 AAA family ATPase [Streptomyces sp. NBC_00424]WUD46262.1 AAA family ATPase [Streptomyces sp. NBC_00513]
MIKDKWNDYGFVTTFDLRVRLTGKVIRVGYVRIGHRTLTARPFGTWETSEVLPTEFMYLSDDFFSLAHQDDYYVALKDLPSGAGRIILRALNDIAYNADLRERYSAYPVYEHSLLRDQTPMGLRRLERIAKGLRGHRVAFEWSYTPLQEGVLNAHEFRFEVSPESRPPTSVHALIGRNGVGKSRLLHDIAAQVMAGHVSVKSSSGGEDNSFTGCVSASFSPFDRPYQIDDLGEDLRFSYIGLRKNELELKSDADLREEFTRSFNEVRIGATGERWLKAIETLNYSASGFLDEHSDDLIEVMRHPHPEYGAEVMGRIFDGLSSGHKAVLLLVTRLVRAVRERTLVLIDEPETHLHPPLLAALTRALSDLLTDRNGMAVIATHSPVVLQEVPASCVWRMFRSGSELTASRPTMETYGESVGELTYEAFGLETTSTGFHAAIAEAVEEGGTFEDIAARFTGLGSEARSLLRAMTYARTRGRD